MAKSLILLLLVSLVLCLASAHQQLLVLIPNGDQQLMEKFLAGPYDVRGLFGSYVFLMSSPESFSSLSAQFPGALSFSVSSSRPISIVEGETSNPQWAEMVAEIMELPRHRILFQSSGLLVTTDFSAHPKDFAQSLSSIPFDAEPITLPEAGIIRTLIPQEHPIAALRKNLKRRESVSELVAAINEDDLLAFALHLTGESSESDFNSRQSQSTDAVRAGEWAASVFESYGFNVTIDNFSNNYCPNIIAEKTGSRLANTIVILGAHLDDRNTLLNDNTGRAPGANDDGSGSAAILQIAKAISDVRATFASTIRLALWCGEEQGLVGSRDYAKRSLANGDNILGMFQADMIAYQAYAAPQCAFVNRYTNTELTSFAKEAGALYVPEITQVETTACCSDHQSFYELGYPSVGLVEGGGYTIDPKYHNVGDLVNRDGYSLTQMRGIARTLIASAAELAGMN